MRWAVLSPDGIATVILVFKFTTHSVVHPKHAPPQKKSPIPWRTACTRLLWLMFSFLYSNYPISNNSEPSCFSRGSFDLYCTVYTYSHLCISLGCFFYFSSSLWSNDIRDNIIKVKKYRNKALVCNCSITSGSNIFHQ